MVWAICVARYGKWISRRVFIYFFPLGCFFNRQDRFSPIRPTAGAGRPGHDTSRLPDGNENITRPDVRSPTHGSPVSVRYHCPGPVTFCCRCRPRNFGPRLLGYGKISLEVLVIRTFGCVFPKVTINYSVTYVFTVENRFTCQTLTVCARADAETVSLRGTKGNFVCRKKMLCFLSLLIYKCFDLPFSIIIPYGIHSKPIYTTCGSMTRGYCCPFSLFMRYWICAQCILYKYFPV